MFPYYLFHAGFTLTKRLLPRAHCFNAGEKKIVGKKFFKISFPFREHFLFCYLRNTQLEFTAACKSKFFEQSK